MPDPVVIPGLGAGGQIVTLTPQATLSGAGISHTTARILSPLWEEIDGYRESYREDVSAVRYFSVPWSLRASFVDDCLGSTTNLGEGKIGRIVPVQHPERPWLYAADVEMVGTAGAWRISRATVALDSNGQPLNVAPPPAPGDGFEPPEPPPVEYRHIPMIEYFDNGELQPNDLYPGAEGRAVYAVTYRVLPYAVKTDQNLETYHGGYELARWVSRQETYAQEAIALPGQYKFAEAPYLDVTVPPNAAPLLLNTRELIYTWHEVPDVPRDVIDEFTGAVNDDDFDGLRGRETFAAETLLMLPPRVTERRVRSTGRVVFDITYRFKYRRQTWNKLPAADRNYYLVTADGTAAGTRIYERKNFNALFRVPAEGDYQ